MRGALLILLGLAVVVVGGAVAVLLALDFNRYKPDIEAGIEAVTGRDVSIAGDVRAAFLPALALSVSDVTVAGAPGGSGEPFLKLPEVLAVVSLPSLVSLDPVVERVRLIEPAIVLETRNDGPASWELRAAGAPASPGDFASAVKIESIDIQDARIEWRDGAVRRSFERVDLWIDALGPDGPFEAGGKFLFDGRLWDLDLDLGRLTKPRLSVNATLASGEDALVKVAGAIAREAGPVTFSGQVEARAARLTTLTRLVDPRLAPAGAENLSFALDADASVSLRAARFSDMAVELGGSQATGELSVRAGEKTSVDLSLTSRRLDVDTLSGSMDAAGKVGESGAAAPWPSDLSVRADIGVDAAIYRGEPIRRLRVAAALEDGAWEVGRFEATLPGGTAVALSGSVGLDGDAPVFRGPVEANSDNLRATLVWLGAVLDGVPNDRLRRFDIFADIVASEEVLVLTGLDLGVDSTRLTGGVAAKMGEVPVVSADLGLDRIDLDAYLADMPEGGRERSLASVASWLSLVNLDLDARIGTLTYDGVAVGGVVAKGTLLDGRLELESLGASDMAGAALRASGAVDPASGSVALRIGVEAGDAGGLLRLMGIDPPVDPAALGPVELVGDISGDEGRAVVRQRLETALGEAVVDGALTDPFGLPAFDGRFGLRSPSYRTLASALGLDLPEAADSGIAFAADVAATAAGADFDAVLEGLGLVARASGEVAGPPADPAFDLRLRADHAELAVLLRDLGVGGELPDLGAVGLGLTATGAADRVDIVLAPSRIGPSTVRGAIGLTFGERPHVAARLEADSLSLDPFLAAFPGETDLGAPRGFDGRLELVADNLSVWGAVVDAPTAVVETDGGELRIERFDGGLFGGRVALTGAVVSGEPRRLRLDAAVADVDVARLLRHFADSEALTGRLFADLRLTGTGLGRRDIVRTLSGGGSVALRDGAVRGFDLGAVGDRLGGLDDEAAVAAPIAEASGGATRIVAADGTFAIADGVARSQDLTVLFDGGRGDFAVAVDLPRRWIGMEGEARLTGHAAAPAIPIVFGGPIDDPRSVFDTGALESFLAQRVAETVSRELGGVDSLDGEATGTATGSTVNAPRADPADPMLEREAGGVPAPFAAVPVKPEPRDAPRDSAERTPDGPDDAPNGTAPGADDAGDASGGLLNLLGGSPGPDDARDGELRESEPSSRTLDMDRLLDELRQDPGN